MLCQHKGPDWFEAEIVTTKSVATDTMYYVHFVNFDRRLDRWVQESQVTDSNSSIDSTVNCNCFFFPVQMGVK